MQPSSSQFSPILVATPHIWGQLVCATIERFSIPSQLAKTHALAIHFVNNIPLRGVVLDGDWASPNDQEHIASVFDAVQQRTPTVTMIRHVRGFPSLFDAVYQPPLHQFCTLPFDIEELEVRMKRSGMLPESQLS